VAGCSGPSSVCGEGTDPVTVTGLSGTLDDGTPAVEIELLAPESCDVLDTTWMLWNESTTSVSLGEEPTSGTLHRAGVEADERTIFFRDLNLGVRLEYPDDVVGPMLSLTWYSTTVDLAFVDCASVDALLACTVRAP
jgi:hypothetical protein